MHQCTLQNKASSPRWEEAFLFLTLVLVPLLGAFLLFSRHLDHALEQKRQAVRQTLEFRTQHFLKATSPEVVLQKILHGWAKKGTVAFQNFLWTLEKRFPGTFKITAWDHRGQIISLQGPILARKKMWQAIVPRFLLATEPSRLVPEQIASDTDLRNLQAFFGKNVPLEAVLPLRNDFIDAIWLGSPCLLFQGSFPSPPASASTGSADIAGVFAMVLHRSLPQGFWEYATLKMWPGEFADDETPAVAVDVANPHWNAGDGRVHPDTHFRETLWQSYSRRNEEFFAMGQWLAMEVKTPISQTRRVFLVSDFSRAIRQMEDQKFHVRLVLLGILLLAGVIFRAVQRSHYPLSFRWRMSAWFSVAIFLPILGLLFLGHTLLETEKTKFRREAADQMHLFGSRLMERYPLFQNRYGKAIYHHLLESGSTNPEVLLPRLHDLIRRGAISSFYLSDVHGRVAEVSDPLRGPRGVEPLRLALGAGFRLATQQFSTSSAPNLFRANLLRYYRLGAVQTNLITFDIAFQGCFQLLLVEILPEALERKFIVDELRRQLRGRQAPAADYSIIRWEFLSPSGRFPHRSPALAALRHDPAFRGFSVNQAMAGELEITGNPLYYLIPPFLPPNSFRPVLLFPQKPWNEKLARRRQQILMAISISLGISMMLGLILAVSLLGPIGTLNHAVKAIRSGDLGVRLPDLGDNEIGRLNQSYNAMAQGLQERHRMRAFVSSSVMEAVRDETRATARNGEIRTVTVLFSHIKDFHELSKKASPAEIFTVLNEFLAGAAHCMRTYGGDVDKFIGDAVMAIFSGETREMAAVQAALALHEFVQAWNQARFEAGLWTITIGVGINTGDVIMGDLGSARRKDLTVIGDAVNLAARLESVSGAGHLTHIILSESTLSPIADDVIVEPLSVTHVKGKSAPLRLFELIALRAAS
jgi:class 3 adenylate cyclase